MLGVRSGFCLPRCGVHANHRARESLFWAPLGHIGPRGGLDLSSPSALIKVNYLVIRYLHFGSVRGDLQEGNGYGKRRCGYASRCQLALFPMTIPVVSSTKSGFLCSGWASGKRPRDYGSRFFVISVPNGVQSVHNCIVFFKKSPEEKIIQHPY